MKTILALLALLIALPVFAQDQNYVDDLKEIDQTFKNPHLEAMTGCDQTALDAVHTAIRSTIPGHDLPPASAADDRARLAQIAHCYSSVTDKAAKASIALDASISHIGMTAIKDIDVGGSTLTNEVMMFVDDSGNLLQKYNDLEYIRSYVLQAYGIYSDHENSARYYDLVQRYNKLANTVIIAPACDNHVQAHPLHCEASTNSVTGVTQMDCQ